MTKPLSTPDRDEAQRPASRNSAFDDALNARLSELGWKREAFTAAGLNNMQWAWNAATASVSEQLTVSVPSGLIDALMDHHQCDNDGVMCQVSREAVHVAIGILHQLPAERNST